MRSRFHTAAICLITVAVLLGAYGCAPTQSTSASREVLGAFEPMARFETVAVVPEKAEVTCGDQVVATVEKGRRFGVIERRTDRVEIQVCVGNEIRRGGLPSSDVRALGNDDVDFAAEWIRVSGEAHARFDTQATSAKLTAMLDRVAAAAQGGKTAREKVRRIGTQLFDREKLVYVEGQKRLDVLLDRKQGDCFSFSLLYLCIGQRLRMPLYLVTVPDHGLVRYDDGVERFNIETTADGKLMDSDDHLLTDWGGRRLRYRQLGGTDLASQPLATALSSLFCMTGEDLRSKGRLTTACRLAARAVELSPRSTEAYYNWGVALSGLHRYTEACDKYAKALEVNPRVVAAQFNWGVALAQTGHAAEGIQKAELAAKMDPTLQPRVERLRSIVAEHGAPLAADTAREARHTPGARAAGLATTRPSSRPQETIQNVDWAQVHAGKADLTREQAMTVIRESLELTGRGLQGQLNGNGTFVVERVDRHGFTIKIEMSRHEGIMMSVVLPKSVRFVEVTAIKIKTAPAGEPCRVMLMGGQKQLWELPYTSVAERDRLVAALNVLCGNLKVP